MSSRAEFRITLAKDEHISTMLVPYEDGEWGAILHVHGPGDITAVIQLRAPALSQLRQIVTSMDQVLAVEADDEPEDTTCEHGFEGPCRFCEPSLSAEERNPGLIG